jgi:lipopolysaccharide exporter
MSAEKQESIAGGVRRGLMWSTASSVVLRLGNLLVGIAVARLLAPEDIGVFAIGLTVLTILMTLADLGMSVDLVRAADPARRAPTVATVSLVSGVLLALAMTLTARPLAALMEAPDAAGVIIALSWTLVLTSACVVPNAHLQRTFAQRKLFGCALADFTLGTAVTVGLILLGMGPMALAVGRLVGQLAATSLQFVLAGLRPRFGFDRAVAGSALAFGLPLAGANMLSWALLNIDNVVIARLAGPTSLGLYVLAFNISCGLLASVAREPRGQPGTGAVAHLVRRAADRRPARRAGAPAGGPAVRRALERLGHRGGGARVLRRAAGGI